MDANKLIETYHSVWTVGDFPTARKYLADALDFRGSIDTFSKADDFIAALTQLQGMLQKVTVLRRFFSEDGAALLYDCETPTPAGTIRTAEFFTIRDGKISEIRLVFDATELRKLMAG